MNKRNTLNPPPKNPGNSTEKNGLADGKKKKAVCILKKRSEAVPSRRPRRHATASSDLREEIRELNAERDAIIAA